VKYSQAYIPTRKEDPNEAELISHKLLIRGGFIRQLSAGIYSFLPLGWRVVKKIEAIVRDEMDRAGALEVRLPGVQPASLWEESGRWGLYGPELVRFEDRKGNAHCLGPTHEEVMTDLVRNEIRSYRQLPVNLYQIQTKFRDEIRPRAGLMRGREFIMKDAYSFDVSPDAARKSYEQMYTAYTQIFSRCGLKFRPVEADTGNIGGSLSHEFQVLADSGEDAIVSCSNCDYTANVEKAEIAPSALPDNTETEALSLVDTPDVKTVEEVTGFLGIAPKDLIKTLIYCAEEETLAVLTRGDTEINEVKLKAVLGVSSLLLAEDKIVEKITSAPVGFAGPVGLNIRIVADHSVESVKNAVTGANQADRHYRGVNLERDVAEIEFADLRVAVDGDHCGRCGGAFKGYRGIEVGHIFYLGTKYSEAMDARFLDHNGQVSPFEMGCYGIGITRIVSAAIEQNHDGFGIIWPLAIAPYQVIVLAMQAKNEAVMAASEALYMALKEAGIEVLFDDRDERAGSKFKDADLLGIPLRIVVGSRGLEEGVVEFKKRDSKEVQKVPVDEAVSLVCSVVAGEEEREHPC
jgi:prolyl-tRNA synthetase